MRKLLALSLLAAAPMFSGAAVAQGMPQIDAALSAGTFGIGPEISLRYPDYPVGLRLGFNTLNFGHTMKVSGSDYKATADIQSFGTTLDYYPLGTGLRLSAGARFGESELRVRARPASAIRLGDSTYSPDEVGSVTGRATFNSVVPYVGIGYGTTFFDGRMTVSLDAGAAYVGRANVRLAASGPYASDPVVQTDLSREAARIRDKAGDFQFYPAVQFSIGYRF